MDLNSIKPDEASKDKKFVLENKGEIIFSDSKINISDNAKNLKLGMLLVSASGSLYGIASLIKYSDSFDWFLFFIFITLANSISFLFFLFSSTKEEVILDEISSIKVKSRLGNRFLAIKLKNGKRRMVRGIADIYYDLDEYIKDHVPIAN